MGLAQCFPSAYHMMSSQGSHNHVHLLLGKSLLHWWITEWLRFVVDTIFILISGRKVFTFSTKINFIRLRSFSLIILMFSITASTDDRGTIFGHSQVVGPSWRWRILHHYQPSISLPQDRQTSLLSSATPNGVRVFFWLLFCVSFHVLHWMTPLGVSFGIWTVV